VIDADDTVVHTAEHEALASVRRHRGDLRRLEADFPGGFGGMARELRGWRQEARKREAPTASALETPRPCPP